MSRESRRLSIGTNGETLASIHNPVLIGEGYGSPFSFIPFQHYKRSQYNVNGSQYTEFKNSYISAKILIIGLHL